MEMPHQHVCPLALLLHKSDLSQEQWDRGISLLREALAARCSTAAKEPLVRLTRMIAEAVACKESRTNLEEIGFEATGSEQLLTYLTTDPLEPLHQHMTLLDVLSSHALEQTTEVPGLRSCEIHLIQGLAHVPVVYTHGGTARSPALTPRPTVHFDPAPARAYMFR